MSGRVVVVGAVHEASPLLIRLLAERSEVVVGIVTLEADLLAKQSGAVDLGELAKEHTVPVIRVRNINAADSVNKLRALTPDLVVVVGWTRLLSEEVLAVPLRGTVGFHASLLPENRGRAPVNWALIRGESYGGNTMMLLDPGTDTGDIVDQIRLEFSEVETCASAYEKVAQAGADMLVRNIDDLLVGSAPRVPQDSNEGSENGRRTPEMGIVDWRRPAIDIHNWIRAQTRPYPGAFGTLNGHKVSLWSAQICDMQQVLAPGEVVSHADHLIIGCGDGAVVVTDWSIDDVARPALHTGTFLDPISDHTRDWSLGLLNGILS